MKKEVSINVITHNGINYIELKDYIKLQNECNELEDESDFLREQINNYEELINNLKTAMGVINE
jgi:DNA-directed RNA polymerase specialized sigma54-like protein